MPAAVFDNVVKIYKSGIFGAGGVTALGGVSLSIPSGSSFALIGPNRAGKTTMIKLLLSLSSPTSGSITRLDLPVADRCTLGRIGYMHENHAFPRYLSASELLQFYGGLSGVSSEELNEHVDSNLKRVGLADRQSEPIARFSKGMVQRLGLAQALINEPELLILDEPTEGLDLFGRNLLRQIVRERKAAGKTVLLVSHVLTEVEELCDRVAVIVAGSIVYTGLLADLVKGRSLETALRPLYEKEVAA